jgi:hypothetical protein
MTINSYKNALIQAQADLEHAANKRDEWVMEVARLEQLVKSLEAMCERGKDSTKKPEEIGIQELVFTCVRMSPKPVTAKDVKRQIEAIGYDLGKYSNPLAVIHGALNRLADSDRITRTGDVFTK